MIKVLRMFLIIVLLLCAMVFAEDLPVADSAVVDDAVAAGSPSSGGLPRIAVYVVGDVPENERRVLGVRILNALVRSGRYTGAERSNAFFSEMDAEQTKDADDGKISELAKRFSVEHVFIAELTQVFGDYNVAARIIDIENATVVSIGEAHGPLRTLDDLVRIADGVVQNMFGGRPEIVPEPAPVAVAPPPPPPPPAPIAVAPPPPPVSVSVSVSAPLPAPIALRTGTSMADRAKTAAAEKILETVMSQIIPQIKRMVASAPVSAELKADAEQRLTLTARNLVTTMLNDGMSGKMPNPQALLTQVLGEIKNHARELLGSITIDIEVAGGGAGGHDGSGKRMSWGFGGFYANDFGGGIKWTNSDERVRMPYNIGGGYVFFDLIYFEAFSGYSGGSGSWKSGGYDNLRDMSHRYWHSGLFFKTPTRVFPIGGIEHTAFGNGGGGGCASSVREI